MFTRLGGFGLASFCASVVMSLGINSASAGVINLANCSATHVSITGVGTANSCIGLIENSTGGQPRANDSEGLLNNALFDSTTPVANQIWSAAGAFGINTWSFLGKDEQSAQSYIDLTSGNPATWTVNPALITNQAYLFAAKQGGQLGLYYFSNVNVAATGGTVDMNAIFGDGITDQGWSHFSIYTSDASNPLIPMPEPSIVALLGIGLLGLGVTRRRQTRQG